MISYKKLSEKEFKTAYIAAWMVANGNSPRQAMNEAERAWESLQNHVYWDGNT